MRSFQTLIIFQSLRKWGYGNKFINRLIKTIIMNFEERWGDTLFLWESNSLSPVTLTWLSTCLPNLMVATDYWTCSYPWVESDALLRAYYPFGLGIVWVENFPLFFSLTCVVNWHTWLSNFDSAWVFIHFSGIFHLLNDLVSGLHKCFKRLL